MSKIPLFYTDDEFFSEFDTSCYINHEQMIDVFPLYRHNFVEVSLVLDGNGDEIINSTTYLIKKGSLSVTLPWHFHTLHTTPEKPVSRFICEFSLEDYLRFAEVWPGARDYLYARDALPCVQLTEDQFAKICGIFNNMYEVFTGFDEDKQVKLYLKIIEFMMIFHGVQRALGRSDQGTVRVAKEGVAIDALRYIHRHFGKDISMTDVGKALGVSTSVLREQLAAYTGQDFATLLNDIRIRNACVLLGLKTPTIKYIAQNTGFQSIQTFYRVFREAKGITPESYRKMHWLESEGKAGYLMYNNLVWDILYFVHKHFDEPITPQSVADVLNISVSYLHKTIKYNLMQSFSEMLHEIRINYSCGLLRSTDMPLTQIAVEVGYTSTKTFHRAFAAQMGCPPNEYRNRKNSKA